MTYSDDHRAHGVRDAIGAVFEAAQDTSRVAGLTHGFYRYPARFSPTFARAAIDVFTNPGDLVLDPFMGGGTSIVEARTRGRRAYGSDTSSLAVFVAKVKTTSLTRRELNEVTRWVEKQADRKWPAVMQHRTLGLGTDCPRNFDSQITWRLRDYLQAAIDDLDSLATARSQRFARAVLLKTAQWAVDTRRQPRGVPEVRKRLLHDVTLMAQGLEEFRDVRRRADKAAGIASRRQIVQKRSADTLGEGNLVSQLGVPRLVLTSPPYPGVHVLYHRWQMAGGRETPAPFWIAGELDGLGASSYTLADRYNVDAYFERHQTAFGAIAKLCDRRTVVVQLVAFSDPEAQLARYKESMQQSGFRELEPAGVMESRWRQVPSRKWYSAQRGHTPASRELVLFHALD